jgi:hypothetical protein
VAARGVSITSATGSRNAQDSEADHDGIALEDIAGRTSRENVVSLTFDDASATQFLGHEMLRSPGMVGTLYVNSALMSRSKYYMTWQQIHNMARAGTR